MAISVPILAIIFALHLIAFVFAVGAERRRSFAEVVPDQYDERTYCLYSTDASTVYGLSAFGLLLLSQVVVNGVTRCLCFGKGLVSATSSTTCAIFFFVFSWLETDYLDDRLSEMEMVGFVGMRCNFPTGIINYSRVWSPQS
ncbi:hypothetical protein GOBAR_DD19804 [Gossypium barbadense]|nr:hypothetical protein GOBAR_DD19804 [Gossypium barbadense]